MKYDSLIRCQQLYEEFCEFYIKQLNTWIEFMMASNHPLLQKEKSKFPKAQ